MDHASAISSTWINWNSYVRKICSISLIVLFIQLFPHISKSHGDLFYFLHYDICIIILFNLSQLLPAGALSDWFVGPFDMTQHSFLLFGCVCLFPYFLSLEDNALGSSCIFPGISHFSMRLENVLVVNDIYISVLGRL